jgi:hypothetical protein
MSSSAPPTLEDLYSAVAEQHETIVRIITGGDDLPGGNNAIFLIIEGHAEHITSRRNVIHDHTCFVEIRNEIRKLADQRPTIPPYINDQQIRNVAQALKKRLDLIEEHVGLQPPSQSVTPEELVKELAEQLNNKLGETFSAAQS